MKKGIFLIILLFSAGNSVFADEREGFSFLEKLWDYSGERNIDLIDAAFDEAQIKVQLDNYWQTFLPSLRFGSGAVFSEYENEVSLLPENIEPYISISQKIFSGAVLSLSPCINLTKLLKDYQGDKEFSNIEYKDYTSLKISFMDYLCSFNQKYDDEKKILSVSRKASELQKELTVLSVREKLTEMVINYRQNERNIDSYTHVCNVLRKKIDTYLELFSRKQIAMSEIFKLQDELVEYEEKIYSMELSQKTLRNSISKEVNLSEGVLFTEIDFLSSLPLLENYVEKENPSVKYLELQKALIEADYVSSKKKMQPVISVSCNIPLHCGERNLSQKIYAGTVSKNFSVDVSFDFSKFLSKNKFDLDKNFKLKTNRLKEHENYTIEGIKSEFDLFEGIFKKNEMELKELEKNLVNREKILNSLKELFRNGKCSEMEVNEAESACYMQKNSIENKKDFIWFYKWMKNNRVLCMNDR